MTADVNKPESNHQKFAALCYYRFLPDVHYSFAYTSGHSKLQFLMHCSLFKLTLVSNTVLPNGRCSSSSSYSVSPRLFLVQFRPINDCLSTRCTSVANAFCALFPVFTIKIFSRLYFITTVVLGM
jgi:hypothetical protein